MEIRTNIKVDKQHEHSNVLCNIFKCGKIVLVVCLVCHLKNRTCDCIKWHSIWYVNCRGKWCNLRNSIAKINKQTNKLNKKHGDSNDNGNNCDDIWYVFLPAIMLTKHIAWKTRQTYKNDKQNQENHASKRCSLRFTLVATVADRDYFIFMCARFGRMLNGNFGAHAFEPTFQWFMDFMSKIETDFHVYIHWLEWLARSLTNAMWLLPSALRSIWFVCCCCL